MKIVILDGYTLNPGDLSWDPLERLGSLEVYARSKPEEVADRIRDAEIVLTNKAMIDASAIQTTKNLRYIGVLATGYNVVDLEAARGRGIPVTNVPGYGTPAVAQTVFAHVLALTHGIERHAAAVSEGEWASCPDFCFTLQPLTELRGLVFGLIGYGQIARQVACIAKAFEMEVLAYSRSSKPGQSDGLARFASRDEVFEASDVLSLHCPLTDETASLINATSLKQMKSSAILINTGRGPLIDEAALAEALQKGEIGGAGLDVLCQEPPSSENPLYRVPNCLISPHLAWATRSARQRLLDIVVSNLRSFEQGTEVNVVNR